MAVGADYLFELISIESYAPQFVGYDKSFLGSVITSITLLHTVKTKRFVFFMYQVGK